MGTGQWTLAGRGTFALFGEPVEVDYELVQGDVVVGGDIVLDPSWEIGGASAGSFDPHGFSQNGPYWLDGVVPYTIDSSVRSTHRGYIESAIQEWNDKTPIRWVPRNGETAYVEFIELDNNACRAELGYTGERRQVKLRNGSTYCNLGVVTHEMGHSVGLVHEQNRDDANDYVQNLDGCLDGFGGHEVGPFDICSTMLYRSSTLGSCRIKLKPGTVSDHCPASEECPGTTACGLYHNWATLSPGDVAMINELYRPTDPDPDAGPGPDPDADPDPHPGSADAGLTETETEIIGGCQVAGGSGSAISAIALALVLLLAAARSRPETRRRSCSSSVSATATRRPGRRARRSRRAQRR